MKKKRGGGSVIFFNAVRFFGCADHGFLNDEILDQVLKKFYHMEKQNNGTVFHQYVRASTHV